MKSTDDITRLWKKNTLLVIFLIMSVSIGTTIIIVYALDYVASVLDTISIIDEPTPRTTTEDSISITEGANNNNQIMIDDLSPIEGTGSSDSIKDTVGMSDSASVPTVTVRDSVAISDNPFYSPFIDDDISFNDSVSTSFVPAPADSGGEGQEDGRQVDGSIRVVKDGKFLEENPLERMEIRNLYLVNDRGSALVEIKAGQTAFITATIRNFQDLDQSCIVIMQVTDQDKFTRQIFFVSMLVNGGDFADLRETWQALEPGTYELRIMVWNDLEDPMALGDLAVKEIMVNESFA